MAAAAIVPTGVRPDDQLRPVEPLQPARGTGPSSQRRAGRTSRSLTCPPCRRPRGLTVNAGTLLDWATATSLLADMEPLWMHAATPGEVEVVRLLSEAQMLRAAAPRTDGLTAPGELAKIPQAFPLRFALGRCRRGDDLREAGAEIGSQG